MVELPKDHGLIVRHDERQAVDLPAELVVCPRQAAQIHFSATSDSVGPHCIACRVLDVSVGGIGLESRHFLPRMAEGVIRVFGRENGSLDAREVLLEQSAKVRRVEMVGREPRYMLGLAFTDRSPDLSECVEALLRRAGNRLAEDARPGLRGAAGVGEGGDA